MTTRIITYIDSTAIDFWPSPNPFFPTFKNGYSYLNRDYTVTCIDEPPFENSCLLFLITSQIHETVSLTANSNVDRLSLHQFIFLWYIMKLHWLHCVGECNFQTLDNEPDVMMSGNQHRLGNICGRLRHRLFVIEHCD